MSLFGAIDISATGVNAMQSWINTNAGNVANADDVVAEGKTPYQEQVAEFTPAATSGDGTGAGVDVSVVAAASSGIVENDPSNPLADSKGDVMVPNISLGDQLVGLVEAQQSYGADTSAISRALTAYQAGLGIGS